MVKGKLILLLFVMISFLPTAGQESLFPYTYKYPPSDPIFGDMIRELTSLSASMASKADLQGLEECIDQLTDFNNALLEIDAATVENLKGILAYYRNDLAHALNHYLRALEIYKTHRDTRGINLILNNIAIIFSKVHDYESTKKYILRALEYTDPDDIPSRSIYLYNLIEIEMDLNNYEAALDLAFSLLDEFDAQRIPYSEIAIKGLVIGCYNKLGQHDKAAAWFDPENCFAPPGTDYVDKTSYYPYVMEYMYKEGEYNMVVEMGKEIIPPPEESFYDDLELALDMLSASHAGLGQFEKAMEIDQKAVEIDFRRPVVDREILISLLMTEYAFEREINERNFVNREIQTNRSRSDAQRRMIWIFLLSSIIIGASVIVLLRARKIRIEVTDNLLMENEKLAGINREINENNRLLEKENNLLDTLISVFAHDLINPFQAILGFSNLMISEYEKLTDDDLVEYSSILSQTAFQLNQLLINLRGMAVVQDENREREASRLKVTPVIENVVRLFKPSYVKKDIKVEIDSDDDIYAYINQEIFESIMRNLVSNSVKFSKPGGEISIRSFAENGWSVIEVEDHGMGMSKQTIDKLVGREYFISRPGTRSETGSGLGLSICIELLEIYMGNLEINSEEGKGTTIIVKIPSGDE